MTNKSKKKGNELPEHVIYYLKGIQYTSTFTLHQELFQSLYEALDSKEARPGSFFATETLIRKETNFSRTTIRRALNKLVRGGHLTRITGQGTFVSIPNVNVIVPELKSLTQELIDNGMKPGAELLSSDRILIPDYIKNDLKKDEKNVLNVKRVRTGNGIPIFYSNAYFPESIEIKEEEDFTKSLYEILRKNKHFPVRATHTIKAILIGKDISKILNTNENSAGLFVTRKTYDNKDELILYEEGIGDGDLYTYSLEMKSVFDF